MPGEPRPKCTLAGLPPPTWNSFTACPPLGEGHLDAPNAWHVARISSPSIYLAKRPGWSHCNSTKKLTLKLNSDCLNCWSATVGGGMIPLWCAQVGVSRWGGVPQGDPQPWARGLMADWCRESVMRRYASCTSTRSTTLLSRILASAWQGGGGGDTGWTKNTVDKNVSKCPNFCHGVLCNFWAYGAEKLQ